MTILVSDDQLWRPSNFELESELEQAILELKDYLFGPKRVYVDVKRLIGDRKNRRNVPDGYLIDLAGGRPGLFIVENELAWHDPLDHIAVQILQFSLSFESDRRGVRNILLDALHNDSSALQKCESYAIGRDYRNLDHFMDDLVFNSPFSAMVIIDELSPRLENVLAKKFRFDVRVLTLTRNVNEAGDFLYQFLPFDEEEFDVDVSPSRERRRIPDEELDTVVTPEHENGFSRWQENWCFCRKIPYEKKDQIKFIAVYRIAPVSAITHIAEVEAFEPRDDNEDWVFVRFAGEPMQLPKPIARKPGGLPGIRTRRYANRQRLLAANNLDEVFYVTEESRENE